MTQHRFLLPFCAGIFLACSSYAQQNDEFAIYKSYIKKVGEKVSIDEGADLVELAIVGTPYDHAGYGIPSHRNETFMVYEIPGKYEGIVAWLAVNPWTGDVWNMNECTLFSNPGLLKAQATIKKKFNKKELKEYDRLHHIKPYREYDLEPCP